MNLFNIFTQRFAVLALILTGSLIPMSEAKAEIIVANPGNVHAIEYRPRGSLEAFQLFGVYSLRGEADLAAAGLITNGYESRLVVQPRTYLTTVPAHLVFTRYNWYAPVWRPAVVGYRPGVQIGPRSGVWIRR